MSHSVSQVNDKPLPEVANPCIKGIVESNNSNFGSNNSMYYGVPDPIMKCFGEYNISDRNQFKEYEYKSIIKSLITLFENDTIPIAYIRRNEVSLHSAGAICDEKDFLVIGFKGLDDLCASLSLQFPKIRVFSASIKNAYVRMLEKMKQLDNPLDILILFASTIEFISFVFEMTYEKYYFVSTLRPFLHNIAQYRRDIYSSIFHHITSASIEMSETFPLLMATNQVILPDGSKAYLHLQNIQYNLILGKIIDNSENSSMKPSLSGEYLSSVLTSLSPNADDSSDKSDSSAPLTLGVRAKYTRHQLKMPNAYMYLNSLLTTDILNPLVPSLAKPSAEIVADMLSFDFNLFNYPIDIMPEITLQLAYLMFDDLKLLQYFNIPSHVMFNFLYVISKHYNVHNQYHNWYHGWSTLHYTYVIIKHSLSYSHHSPLHILAMMVASVCHDVDHSGNNNNFEKQCGTVLIRTFGSLSVLERFHTIVTYAVIHSSEYQANIFANLTQGEYATIRSYINELILGTDMTYHHDIYESIKYIGDYLGCDEVLPLPNASEVVNAFVANGGDIGQVASLYNNPDTPSSIKPVTEVICGHSRDAEQKTDVSKFAHFPQFGPSSDTFSLPSTKALAIGIPTTGICDSDDKSSIAAKYVEDLNINNRIPCFKSICANHVSHCTNNVNVEARDLKWRQIHSHGSCHHGSGVETLKQNGESSSDSILKDNVGSTVSAYNPDDESTHSLANLYSISLSLAGVHSPSSLSLDDITIFGVSDPSSRSPLSVEDYKKQNLQTLQDMYLPRSDGGVSSSSSYHDMNEYDFNTDSALLEDPRLQYPHMFGVCEEEPVGIDSIYGHLHITDLTRALIKNTYLLTKLGVMDKVMSYIDSSNSRLLEHDVVKNSICKVISDEKVCQDAHKSRHLDFLKIVVDSEAHLDLLKQHVVTDSSNDSITLAPSTNSLSSLVVSPIIYKNLQQHVVNGIPYVHLALSPLEVPMMLADLDQIDVHIAVESTSDTACKTNLKTFDNQFIMQLPGSTLTVTHVFNNITDRIASLRNSLSSDISSTSHNGSISSTVVSADQRRGVYRAYVYEHLPEVYMSYATSPINLHYRANSSEEPVNLVCLNGYYYLKNTYTNTPIPSSLTPPHSPYSILNTAQLLAICKAIVHTADISCQSLSPRVVLLWTERLRNEFLLQHRKETILNINPTGFMGNLIEFDNFVSSQLSFIGLTMIPLWIQLVRLYPNMYDSLVNLYSNLDMWSNVAIARKVEIPDSGYLDFTL